MKERIAAAVEFAKAHRAYEYDREAFAQRYRRAGVPNTEAAEKSCREWDGGFEHCRLFPGDSRQDVIDLSEIIDDMKSLDRDTFPERLCRYCTEYCDQEKYPGGTLILIPNRTL